MAQKDLPLFDSALPEDSQKKTTGHYARCYESHPVLTLGGGTFVGGSCSNPMVLDADLYIGFEHGQKVVTGDLLAGGPQQVFHHIYDMRAPANHLEFKALVTYTASVLAKGNKVHAGCIGGHGRTGTFLAALVKEITGQEDSITWVRENYCHKAVESKEQVSFLMKHYGIKEAVAHKESKPAKGYYTPPPPPASYPTKSLGKSVGKATAIGVVFKEHLKFDPVPSKRCLVEAGMI